jgi:hypothetical protein
MSLDVEAEKTEVVDAIIEDDCTVALQVNFTTDPAATVFLMMNEYVCPKASPSNKATEAATPAIVSPVHAVFVGRMPLGYVSVTLSLAVSAEVDVNVHLKEAASMPMLQPLLAHCTTRYPGPAPTAFAGCVPNAVILVPVIVATYEKKYADALPGGGKIAYEHVTGYETPDESCAGNAAVKGLIRAAEPVMVAPLMMQVGAPEFCAI